MSYKVGILEIPSHYSLGTSLSTVIRTLSRAEMGWAPALDLRALTVLCVREELKKAQELLWDSHFPSLW